MSAAEQGCQIVVKSLFQGFKLEVTASANRSVFSTRFRIPTLVAAVAKKLLDGYVPYASLRQSLLVFCVDRVDPTPMRANEVD